MNLCKRRETVEEQKVRKGEGYPLSGKTQKARGQKRALPTETQGGNGRKKKGGTFMRKKKRVDFISIVPELGKAELEGKECAMNRQARIFYLESSAKKGPEDCDQIITYRSLTNGGTGVPDSKRIAKAKLPLRCQSDVV